MFIIEFDTFYRESHYMEIPSHTPVTTLRTGNTYEQIEIHYTSTFN